MTSSDTSAQMVALAARGWVPEVTPPKLLDTDLPRAGYAIKVGEDEIHAVLDVEAPNGGYDKLGRLVILYEPHIAYRVASPAVRARLVAAGLAYPKWGEKPYPKESYSRFTAAYRIDPEVAVRACSLGRGQVLGDNFAICGFTSPTAMYVAMVYGGEAEHLRVMIAFIKGNHLDDELRNHNWAGFARGYNGPKYAVNNYHTKLATRYAWWVKRPDTPWSPTMDHVTAPEAVAPPIVVVHTPQITLAPTAPAVQPRPAAPTPLPTVRPVPTTAPGAVTKRPGLWRRFGAWLDDVFYLS